MSEHKKIIKREFHFVGIGAAKCGTTALWYYLMQHPDLYSGPGSESRHPWLGIDSKGVAWAGLEIKEPNLFNTPADQYNLKKYALWIEKMNSAPEDKLLGEFTVHYINDIDALYAIKAHSPNAKILANLRNPVERFYSHMNHHHTRLNPERKSDFPELIKQKNFMDHFGKPTLYLDKIKNCYKVFPKEQIKFIKYEDFRDNNEQTVMDVLKFLNLDTSKYVFKKEQVLFSHWKSPMTEEVREAIKNYVLQDIDEIEELLGWDCSDWRE